ncbi:MAG: MFS transporter, partial [Candidatus Melainabacteria bacterium]|nr:MFS transporter [Candidatus Melainabacteria bacterium]
RVPPGKSYLQIGLHRLHQTLSQALQFQDLLSFLSSLFFLSCGSSTVIVLAAVYASEVMSFKTSDTIILMLTVNISALFGALAFGHIQDKVGSVRTMAVTLLLWIIAILLASSVEAHTGFWLAANLMGVAMGACQSAGRALVGQFSPAARSGEFFGLWGLACKLAAIVGPLTYGGLTYLNGGNHRQSLLFTAVFFLVSLVLLVRVNEHRGRLAAQGAISRATGFSES